MAKKKAGANKVIRSAAVTAAVDNSREYFSSLQNGGSGIWAGQQMLKALQENKPFNASVLRTADVLTRDQWKEFDTQLLESNSIRLRGIADLRSRGLVRPISGGLGKTVFEYQNVGDMNPAQVSMDGAVRTEDDRIDYGTGAIPLPLIHKDYNLNLRTLAASRLGGEPLDTTQTRVCGRLIAEQQENMLFNGGPQFNSMPIYGYLTHPDRNTVNYSNGVWGAGVATGDDMIDDIIEALGALEADRMFGPFVMYIPSGMGLAMARDFKTGSDKSIRARLLEIENLDSIVTSDQMPAGKVVIVQMTSDVVELLEAQPLTNVQWDIQGGFRICFKSYTISVPLIRSDADNRCGVCVIEAA